MTFVNLIGIISLVVILGVGTILKLVSRKILRSIEGFGGFNKKGSEKGNLICKG